MTRDVPNSVVEKSTKSDKWRKIKYYEIGDKVSVNPNKENLAKLKELIDRGKPESENH